MGKSTAPADNNIAFTLFITFGCKPLGIDWDGGIGPGEKKIGLIRIQTTVCVERFNEKNRGETYLGRLGCLC